MNWIWTIETKEYFDKSLWQTDIIREKTQNETKPPQKTVGGTLTTERRKKKSVLHHLMKLNRSPISESAENRHWQWRSYHNTQTRKHQNFIPNFLLKLTNKRIQLHSKYQRKIPFDAYPYYCIHVFTDGPAQTATCNAEYGAYVQHPDGTSDKHWMFEERYVQTKKQR